MPWAPGNNRHRQPDDDCAGEYDDEYCADTDWPAGGWVDMSMTGFEKANMRIEVPDYENMARQFKEQIDRLHTERAGLMQQITILADENRRLTRGHDALVRARRRAEIMRDALADRLVAIDEELD